MASENQIVVVLLLALVALIGLVIVGGVAGPASNVGAEHIDERIDDLSASETYDIGVDLDVDIEVLATRGNAVSIDGQGYVDVPLDETWADGDWSVLLSANLADDANENAAYQAFVWDDETIRIQWENGDIVAYYDSGTDTASVSVPGDADEWNNVAVTWDDTADELTIEVDGVSDSAVADGADEDLMLAADWRGELDEIRVLEVEASASDISTYAGDPVAVLPDNEDNHEGRLMFNEGSGSTVEVFYAGSTGTLVDATWGTGNPDPGLDEGVDYELGDTTVTILDGYLDGAPVAFVTGETLLGDAFDAVVGGFGDAMALVPVAMIAIVAVLILALVASIRRGA